MWLIISEGGRMTDAQILCPHGETDLACWSVVAHRVVCVLNH